MVARMPHPTAPGRLPVHWSGSSDPAATTLVLLHGLTDSGECWPDAVERWQGTYRIAAPDARGHGASPRYTADQLAADPIELMKLKEIVEKLEDAADAFEKVANTVETIALKES